MLMMSQITSYKFYIHKHRFRIILYIFINLVEYKSGIISQKYAYIFSHAFTLLWIFTYSYDCKFLPTIVNFNLNTPFNISYRPGLVAMNSLRFCIIENVLIFFILKRVLLDVEFSFYSFFLYHFKMHYPNVFWLQKFLLRNLLIILLSIHVHDKSHFSG